MTLRISLGTVLVGLGLVALGAGGAVGVMLWEPWDGGDRKSEVGEVTPAPGETSSAPVKRLIATEAAEFAEDWLRGNPYSGRAVVSPSCGTLPAILLGQIEESPEYNSATNQWIVPCQFVLRENGVLSNVLREHFRVDADTGSVSFIE